MRYCNKIISKCPRGCPKGRYSRRQKKVPPFDPYNGRPFKKNGRRTEIERAMNIFRTYSRLILISPFPFSGTGEYTHARMSRALFLSRVLLLEAKQEQTSKLRIFLIKLGHSSSSYENTFAFSTF